MRCAPRVVAIGVIVAVDAPFTITPWARGLCLQIAKVNLLLRVAVPHDPI